MIAANVGLSDKQSHTPYYSHLKEYNMRRVVRKKIWFGILTSGVLLLAGCSDDSNSTTYVDEDGDGYSVTQGDCNDHDRMIHPKAQETYGDGIDQDCDGKDLTEGSGQDQDKDGYTVQNGDCNDNDANINPGAVEICGDEIDQDCDGKDTPCASDNDADKDGYTLSQGDCNDNDQEVHPGVKEVPYNGKDDDCDPQTKDDDLDGDGFAKNGGGDCNDNNKSIFPGATEIPYDGIDQDCSGKDLTDVDHDGADSIKVSGGKDCDDLNPAIRPNATEIPFDSVDQNCDGSDFITTDSFTIATLSQSTNIFEVAFNGSVYLVTYMDYVSTDSIYYLRGQFVSTSGALTGKPFDIYSSKTNLNYLSVSSSGSSFLVVWSLYDAGIYVINGQIVNSNGGLSGKTFTIRTTSYSPQYLDSAFENSVYAVTWGESISSSTNYIYAQRLNTAGSRQGGMVQLNSTINTYLYGPTIASSGSGFLVTWYVYNSSQANYYDVFGRIMSSSGSLVGTEFLISDALNYQTEPTSAFGTDFLTVWTDSRNGNYDIYGQRISKSGTLIGTTSDQNFPISSALGSQQNPKVLFCNNRFNVIFRDGRFPIGYSIYRQPLDADGKLIEATADNNIVLYANQYSIYNMSVVCGGNKALAIFRESLGSNYLITGILFNP